MTARPRPTASEASPTVREAANGPSAAPLHCTDGGAALHMGNIAEMLTGEGQTLVGPLPRT